MKIFTIFAMAAVVSLPTAALAQTSAGVYFNAQTAVETEYEDGRVGAAFTLDGSRSTDDGTVRTFTWKQVSGPYKFATQTGSKVAFTPPTAGTYVFELSVTDSAGKTTLVKRVEVKVAAQSTIFQPNQSDADFLTAPATTKESGEKGGTEDINIGVGEQKGGNVEFEWKVEEGESAPPAKPDDIDAADDSEPITPDFGILLGGGGGSDEATEEGRAEVAEILLKGAQEADMPVESVSLNFGKLETKVKQSIKLFGFIPISTAATVEIDAEERVKVKFPWWAFLASGKNSDTLGQRIFMTLSNVLKTKHDTIKNSINNIR